MKKKIKISVIGLGYVGIPMIVATLMSKKSQFEVIGIERNDLQGLKIISKLKNGKIPFKTNDKNLIYNFTKFLNSNLLTFSNDIKKISSSKIIIVSVGYDFSSANNIKNLKTLFTQICKYKKNNSTIIIESTLPPGTCENVLTKIMFSFLNGNTEDLRLAYSFERVTPGKDHLNSVINSYRVYSGINKISKKNCKDFFSKIINTKDFPLTELETITECEMTKIIENSYRSLNIAFIDEWTKFSLRNNLNLNSVIDSIKKRNTHQNIMRPGLGVGGYCLTKDSLLMKHSNKILKQKNLFPLSFLAVKINKDSIENSINFIKKNYLKNLRNKKILILGLAYKENVDDFRNSPSLELANQIKKYNCKIVLSDVFIKTKNFQNKFECTSNPKFNKFDLVLFNVGHAKYKKYSLRDFNEKTFFFDLNFIFSNNKIKLLKNNKIKIYQLGT